MKYACSGRIDLLTASAAPVYARLVVRLPYIKLKTKKRFCNNMGRDQKYKG
jgi:hypothetical protein